MSDKLIYTKISAAMKDIGPIAKDRVNKSQGYAFRGIDDVYQAVQAVLAKHEVFSTTQVMSEKSEEKTSSKGSTLIYRILTVKYTFFTTDGSSIESVVIGEGMDSGDKASNKAMAVAHKYALLQLFCIPTEEPKDPENDSHEISPRATRKELQELLAKIPDKNGASATTRLLEHMSVRSKYDFANTSEFNQSEVDYAVAFLKQHVGAK